MGQRGAGSEQGSGLKVVIIRIILNYTRNFTKEKTESESEGISIDQKLNPLGIAQGDGSLTPADRRVVTAPPVAASVVAAPPVEASVVAAPPVEALS